jgi:hypothetical protein
VPLRTGLSKATYKQHDCGSIDDFIAPKSCGEFYQVYGINDNACTGIPVTIVK